LIHVRRDRGSMQGAAFNVSSIAAILAMIAVGLLPSAILCKDRRVQSGVNRDVQCFVNRGPLRLSTPTGSGHGQRQGAAILCFVDPMFRRSRPLDWYAIKDCVRFKGPRTTFRLSPRTFSLAFHAVERKKERIPIKNPPRSIERTQSKIAYAPIAAPCIAHKWAPIDCKGPRSMFRRF